MFADVRRSEVHSLVKRLMRGASGNEYQVVDMRSIFFEIVMNIMMRMIRGKRYYVDKERDVDSDNLEEKRRKFKEIVTETFLLSGASNFGDFLPILRWIGMNKLENRLKLLKENRENFALDLIDEHRKMESSKDQREKTLIDVLLSLQETDPECYTDEIVRGMIQVMLSTGTDTSMATMEWAMSLLLNNTEALIKAQDEIDNLIGHSRLVDDSDLSQLPYLHGIIIETLRMYPVAPLLVPHESTTKCTVERYQVPQETMLLVNLWAIQNDPKFWNEPRKFKPERFIKLKGQRDEFTLMPFGYGRRGCPGENLAMHVIGLVLASLIQCFEWTRVGKEMVDMTEGSGLTMPKAQPLVAKYRSRLSFKELLSQL